jgi:hypothetical protein
VLVFISDNSKEDLLMKRALLILAVAIFSLTLNANPTDAGTTSTVNITGVDVHNDGIFLIDISQATTGAPACATITNRLSAHSSTAGGKALLQLAISVYLSGKLVSVVGTGACSELSNIESISGIHAQ